MSILEILEAHKPSRWRSFTNENEILRCCGKDFGNATKKAKRGDAHLAWTEFSAHVAQVLEQHEREAKAEAVAEVANAFQYKAWSELIEGSLQDRLRIAQPITDWLRDRSAQLKETR